MKRIMIFLAIVGLATSMPVAAFEKALQSEVADENWQAANRILVDAEAACSDSPGPGACLDKVRFSRAWINTQRAERAEQGKESLLRRAREDYRELLRKYPEHLATIDNLSLVSERLGDVSQLRSNFKTLQRIGEASRSYQVALIIADILRDSGEASEAFAYYRDAFSLNASQRALNGILATFPRATGEHAAADLLNLAGETSNASMRARLFETLLANRNLVGEVQWENAAIGWVSTLGRERSLTGAMVKQSPALSSFDEFKELAGRLEHPWLGLARNDVRIDYDTLIEFRRDGWWQETLPRTWAFSIAAWSEAHNRLLQGDIEGGANILQAALQFAPPTRFYESGSELEGRWAVSLELLTDLARVLWLYQPRIDPDRELFERVQTALFESKAEAYRVNDLEAIQRHHSIMGKMYADLGVFSQSRNGVRSAEFQLSNALRTAERRAGQGEAREPQPLLARLLADGYLCRLPAQNTACDANAGKAQPLYLEAARDYLKLDAFGASRDALKLVSPVNSQVRTEIQQLESLIDLRSSVTAETLRLGENHPDVVRKKIDIAERWQVIGEKDEARLTIDDAFKLDATGIDKSVIYRSLEAGEIDALKNRAIELNRALTSDGIR